MKYLKAIDVLPQYLLEEIHKYIDGCIVYVPQKSGNRRAWGDKSGVRQELQRRNACIKADFVNGTLIYELSEKYGLSEETIKKIVYSH